jgi:two-component system, NarL family, nitrate/nitrite response regulator NarL
MTHTIKTSGSSGFSRRVPQNGATNAQPAPMRPAAVQLTEREHHILTGIAAGKPYREIASGLHLSEDTIRFHACRLFRKLHARDRANAVHIAHQHGLLGGTAPGRRSPAQEALAAPHRNQRTAP